MQIKLQTLLIFAITFNSGLAKSDDGDWREEKAKGEIVIYSRAVSGWDVRQIRGTTIIDSQLSTILEIINDVPSNKKLNPLLEEARIIQRSSDTDYTTYMLLGMPWPVSDRDLISRRTITQDQLNFIVTIQEVAIPSDLPEKKGVVRVSRSLQKWQLTPLEDCRTRVEMTILTDPGGPIPKSIINALSVRSPHDTLSNLRSEVSRAASETKNIEFIKDPHKDQCSVAK